MKSRLATIYCVAILLIGLTCLSIRAQTRTTSPPTLKGIRALTVLVEDLPSGAKALGLYPGDDLRCKHCVYYEGRHKTKA